ncbi:WXG100-like domain-containing protein [Mycobacterium sp. BMJ-28]
MVDVDPQVYFTASASTRFGALQLAGALSTLSSGLSGSAGMAGSDNTGQEFAGGYDQAARDLATVLAGLGDMTGNAADLIKVSGDNHAAANRASADGSAPPPSVPIPAATTTAVPNIPSAYGGGGSEPTGAIATAWNFIQDMVGYVWPNGSPEKLEAAAQAWTTAGNAIKTGADPLDQAKNGLSSQVSPEIPAATEHLADLRGKVDDLSGACFNTATSCNNLAQAIRDAHQQLIDELAQFAAEFVVGEVIFGVLFEVGGEIWGNAAMAARAAVIAQRCARIIEKLIELARGAARIAKAAAEAVAKVAEKVKSAVAAIVTRSNTDRNIDALVKYTKQALDDFDNGTIGLSQKQLKALRDNPNLYDAFKGSVLDAQVKKLVNEDASLRDLTTTGLFKYGPDFVNAAPKAGQAPWYDLTTMKQWAGHAKYEATHGGPGGGIIWNSPGGVTYVPPK